MEVRVSECVVHQGIGYLCIHIIKWLWINQWKATHKHILHGKGRDGYIKISYILLPVDRTGDELHQILPDLRNKQWKCTRGQRGGGGGGTTFSVTQLQGMGHSINHHRHTTIVKSEFLMENSRIFSYVIFKLTLLEHTPEDFHLWCKKSVAQSFQQPCKVE